MIFFKPRELVARAHKKEQEPIFEKLIGLPHNLKLIYR
jgi:hypothetical protein